MPIDYSLVIKRLQRMDQFYVAYAGYNYINLLLYNIKYNCYVVVELKITELKKEHIVQIQTYMNYIDKHIKTINQEKTIGIVVCAKDNKIILEYSSDPRIYETRFILN